MTAAHVPQNARALRGQLWRYAVTGLINTGVGLAIILILHLSLGVDVIIANATGYGAGLLVSFALNRAWTFASRRSVLATGAAYAGLVGLAFALCIALISALQLINLPYVAAQLLGTALYSVIVFVGARHVIFSR